MKFTAVIAFIVGAVTGYAQPANDAAAICTKACQAAPTEQRETCLRVCTQFAEQSAGFGSATAASPSSSAAKNMPTVSVKNSESPAATSSAAASGKEKMRGEDNDEDHEMDSQSMSASHMSSGTQALHVGVGALVAALSAAAFF
ncbi:hypothetical protein GGH12_006102 [Coemansia sp. RSA 1822]|nr:hypothetical protein GGF49_001541 [Coemansia sp. RSA 1853]KAJ2557772.1 hypothetical protein GGH12_006102 [Coemansia sp. RSA 1822]